jgi:hypothetical protein
VHVTAPGTEVLRASVLCWVVLGGAFAWLSFRAAAVAAVSPERLIAEFRAVRFATLLLVFNAGAAVGFAAAREFVAPAALDVTLAAAFVVVAAVAVTKDPRPALLILAAAFLAHALLSIAHRPGFLSPDVAPRWFFIAIAVYDVVLAALCYLPILKR